MNLFGNGKKTTPAISLKDLEAVLGVQGMNLEDVLRGGFLAALDEKEDGAKKVEAGKAQAEEAYEAYVVAATKAEAVVTEGNELIARGTAVTRVLNRLRPNAQDWASPSQG